MPRSEFPDCGHIPDRLMGGGPFKPKNQKLGADVAGTVEAVEQISGSSNPVTMYTGYRTWAAAVLPSTQSPCEAFARKPVNISFGRRRCASRHH
jgi:hypothetical protein